MQFGQFYKRVFHDQLISWDFFLQKNIWSPKWVCDLHFCVYFIILGNSSKSDPLSSEVISLTFAWTYALKYKFVYLVMAHSNTGVFAKNENYLNHTSLTSVWFIFIFYYTLGSFLIWTQHYNFRNRCNIIIILYYNI